MAMVMSGSRLVVRLMSDEVAYKLYGSDSWVFELGCDDFFDTRYEYRNGEDNNRLGARLGSLLWRFPQLLL